MSVTVDQIKAALKKLGPVSPGALYDHLETTAAIAGPVVKDMLAGDELKATGATASRRIALPDQKFEDVQSAPPQQRRKPAGKRKRKGKKAKRASRTPRAAVPSPAPAERFVPTVDAEKRLHIINGAAPVSFSEAQTEAIATLLFQHYSA
jgi:hypothetical protein